MKSEYIIHYVSTVIGEYYFTLYHRQRDTLLTDFFFTRFKRRLCTSKFKRRRKQEEGSGNRSRNSNSNPWCEGQLQGKDKWKSV